jgi:hypothetical protein
LSQPVIDIHAERHSLIASGDEEGQGGAESRIMQRRQE